MSVAEGEVDERWGSWGELSRDELYAIVMLRQEVFVVEQQCIYRDADGRDPNAWHLRWHSDRELVAYLRAFPPDASGYAQIGRVITSARVRGTGLGRPLMRAGIAAVHRTFGPCPIRIEAQSHLVTYYGSLGFRVVGDLYVEDGIPHVSMRADLDGAD